MKSKNKVINIFLEIGFSYGDIANMIDKLEPELRKKILKKILEGS